MRERIEDMKAISAHHIKRLCECYGMQKKNLSPDFLTVLSRYDWPGNVRELINALDRAVSASGHEPVVYPKHLPVYIRVHLARASVGQLQEQGADGGKASENDSETSRHLPTLVEIREAAIAEVERRYLQELMTLSKSMDEACTLSGLSRSRLYALLKNYGIALCSRAT